MPYSFFLDRYADSYVNVMSAFVNYVKTGDESLEPALGIDGKITIFIGEWQILPKKKEIGGYALHVV